MTILLGNGDGTFSSAPAGGRASLGATAMPRGVVSGKFGPHTQGTIDLAVANPNLRNVVVLPGQGNGVFDAPITVLESSGGVAALVDADFNKDGKEDLIALDDSQSRIYVLLAR